MTEKPLFSIVIPVYNTEEYLDRCVSSAVRQTMPDIEILLVDDGSTDGSPALCDSYAARDPRVKVIHKKNGGLSDARNTGIRSAEGEYILLLDSDDHLEENTCELFLPAARTGSDLITGDWIRSQESPEGLNRSVEIRIWAARDYMKDSLRRGKLRMAAVRYLYRREFLAEQGLAFRCGILHEDEEFTPWALLAAKTITATNVVFYHYILREGSITRQKDLRRNAEDLYQTCLSLEKTYQALEDKQLSLLLRDSLAMKTLSLFQDGRLYRHGGKFIHKDFVRRNAFTVKTKLKAALFCASPKLYWHINHFTKGNR